MLSVHNMYSADNRFGEYICGIILAWNESLVCAIEDSGKSHNGLWMMIMMRMRTPCHEYLHRTNPMEICLTDH